MANSVNKVTLLGRLGGDPELKYTPSGTAVAQFSMATSESWMKDNQKQEKTEWHRIVVWGKLAEVCNQYLKKGRQVYLEGQLQTRSWDDKDGKKCYTTEIVAKNIVFTGEKGDSNSQSRSGGGAPTPSEPQGSGFNMGTDSNFTPEDIPF